ncbi:hypothetical protein ILYODFUR_032424 [Ilyodon furcidens]|uniref:Uncharacterized protein n=1 Tax=Ilyodon furcidens TaxID=33524 RepID=A0ABV0UA89_9TELE
MSCTFAGLRHSWMVMNEDINMRHDCAEAGFWHLNATHHARDDHFCPNNKDAHCGLSAYELHILENIIQKKAFLSSLKIWQKPATDTSNQRHLSTLKKSY